MPVLQEEDHCYHRREKAGKAVCGTAGLPSLPACNGQDGRQLSHLRLAKVSLETFSWSASSSQRPMFYRVWGVECYSGDCSHRPQPDIGISRAFPPSANGESHIVSHKHTSNYRGPWKMTGGPYFSQILFPLLFPDSKCSFVIPF